MCVPVLDDRVTYFVIFYMMSLFKKKIETEMFYFYQPFFDFISACYADYLLWWLALEFVIWK